MKQHVTHRYEDERYDEAEWGRGHQEEPEEDWRGRGYSDPEEQWRGQGYDHGYNHGYDHGYDHDRGYDHGQGHGYDRGYDHGQGHGYDRGYDHDRGYERGYDQDQYHGYEQGYGHGREEEEDDRGRSAGYQYGEPEDEPRVIADDSLFRWLAVSYASTHLSMTHNYHGSCQGGLPSGGQGMVNRAKWKPVTGSELLIDSLGHQF